MYFLCWVCVLSYYFETSSFVKKAAGMPVK